MTTAALSDAYATLTAEQARLYRLLGLYPGPTVDIGTVVCLAGADPDTAQDLLYALEDAGLLQEGDDGRYRFCGAARPHARERAGEVEHEAERAAVLERCVDYYTTGTAFADLAVLGELRLRTGGEAARRAGAFDPFAGPDRRRAALGWLLAERQDALAVLRAAVEHDGMAHRAWQLAESLTAVYLHRRHPEDWKECCALGAEAAAVDGARAAEARLRALLSRPLLDLGEEQAAREQLDRALALAEETGEPRLRALALGLDGRYWQPRDPDRARTAYGTAVALSEQADDVRGAAFARCFLGAALGAAGEHEEAAPVLRAAREGLRELADRDPLAGRMLTELGGAWQALGERAEARECYERAVRELRAHQAAHYEAEALEALAAWERDAGDPASAPDLLARALELYEAGDSPRAGELRAELARTGPATGSGA
ncbi:hypothetical protein [Streptomyces boncukensis]|uniref:Tetratricopeptide repeat protein n=1 Tax=Streptomyces boncukensis TaxID=2711219 RepID=A0A6G4X4X0_9ACTN|nr:hypothetical protein [Streptomyces boncukensis]NGO72303.1 hypothetical protein [Streptomyces boncukensis]